MPTPLDTAIANLEEELGPLLNKREDDPVFYECQAKGLGLAFLRIARATDAHPDSLRKKLTKMLQEE